MKKLTTKLMIAATALVVVAGAASAQTMTAVIPFEFRAGDKVMASGTYRVDVTRQTGVPVIRLLNVHSLGSIALVPQAPVDPQKAWIAEGSPKLAFACSSGSCALAELWNGYGSGNAYTFHGPKRGGDEYANLRVIPMQRDKGE